LRSASVINITSAAAFEPQPGGNAYCISKAAAEMLTKLAAQEFVRYGIRVNSIAPGYIDTPNNRFIPGEYLPETVKKTPMGRAGTPAELAAAALFLASKSLGVDGGYFTGR
jgi:NAD(P)-dependent dehydrogenase (short-subunit alcohol dehydrogenase family)